MTTPANNVPAKTIELPAPRFPMVVMMFTDNISSEKDAESTVQWLISKPHPFVPNMNVVRMFVDGIGVEVYSSSNDGRDCMRDLVPMSRIRLVQEGMPIEVFVAELAAAEADDDDDEPEPDFDETSISAPSNGQAASS